MNNINTAEYWDEVHSKKETWRTYPTTFEMIVNEVGTYQCVLEYGCGTGILAEMLVKNNNGYYGIDISYEAVTLTNIRLNKIVGKYSIALHSNILESNLELSGTIAIATEFLEHFKDEELKIIMPKIVNSAPKAIFCVPNDCLGNEICKEHYQKWNKESFRAFLRLYYEDVYILDFIEKYKTEDGLYVTLPTLMAVCWREHK